MGHSEMGVPIIMKGVDKMNVRKNIDYSEMYEQLDMLMAQQLPQTELYCEIGKTVCRRTEKGAAVMASEYLNKQYPGVKGFSPRSLRRMRDFYRTYENHLALLSRAMQLGWIHNVVIMEADLTMELRDWYMKAAKQFAWSKTELIAQIAVNAHENIVLAVEEELCCVTKREEEHDGSKIRINSKSRNESNQNIHILRKLWLIWKEGRRRWYRLIGRNLLKVNGMLYCKFTPL